MSGINCDLCPHHCFLTENHRGLCGVRSVDKKNQLKLISYGKFSAINLDPVEKKPLYHVKPGSSTLSLGSIGCNLSCPWCQNWTISKEFDFTGLTEIMPQELLGLVLEKGYKSVSFTYNEPSISYEYIVEAAKILKENQIDTYIVSSGYISFRYLESFYANVHAANIDLKSFSKKTYKDIIKGDLDTVLASLKFLAQSDTWLEITNLLIPGLNDSEKEIRALCTWIRSELGDHIPLHFSAYYPSYRYNTKSRTSNQLVLKAVRIGRDTGLSYVYSGNIDNQESSATYCPNCHNTLIERNGYFIVNHQKNNRCPFCNRVIEGYF